MYFHQHWYFKVSQNHLNLGWKILNDWIIDTSLQVILNQSIWLVTFPIVYQCLTYRQNQFYKCSAIYVKCTSMTVVKNPYIYIWRHINDAQENSIVGFLQRNYLDLSPFNQLRETLNYILILLCALILGCCKGNLHLTQPSKINVSWRNHGCLRRWHPPPTTHF